MSRTDSDPATCDEPGARRDASPGPRVGLLGLGRMGARYAARLLAARFALSVWNRSPGRAGALRAAGAIEGATPLEVAARADVLLLALENDAAVEAVLFAAGANRALRPGAVVVDLSSISPSTAVDHAARLAAEGVEYLDSPVSGGTGGAEAGTLAIMVGGTAATLARARPVLGTLGRLTHVGPVGSGQLAKLANQIIVGGTLGALAEALRLAAAGGADLPRVLEALGGGFADSRVLEIHGPRMTSGDFATRGRSVTHHKDLVNALGFARPLGLSLPLTELVADRFAALLARYGDLDHAALWLVTGAPAPAPSIGC